MVVAVGIGGAAVAEDAAGAEDVVDLEQAAAAKANSTTKPLAFTSSRPMVIPPPRFLGASPTPVRTTGDGWPWIPRGTFSVVSSTSQTLARARAQYVPIFMATGAYDAYSPLPVAR